MLVPDRLPFAIQEDQRPQRTDALSGPDRLRREVDHVARGDDLEVQDRVGTTSPPERPFPPAQHNAQRKSPVERHLSGKREIRLRGRGDSDRGDVRFSADEAGERRVHKTGTPAEPAHVDLIREGHAFAVANLDPGGGIAADLGTGRLVMNFERLPAWEKRRLRRDVARKSRRTLGPAAEDELDSEPPITNPPRNVI